MYLSLAAWYAIFWGSIGFTIFFFVWVLSSVINHYRKQRQQAH